MALEYHSQFCRRLGCGYCNGNIGTDAPLPNNTCYVGPHTYITLTDHTGAALINVGVVAVHCGPPPPHVVPQHHCANNKEGGECTNSDMSPVACEMHI